MKSLLISFVLIILIPFTSAQDKQKDEKKHKVTFVELGSDRCIPCVQMQPVLKAVKANYGDQVDVIFYDVWKSEGKDYASIYKIQLIPTQVFLNAEGKEFFRHEGFFPEEEIDKLLSKQGLKKISSNKK